jgi:hypothetical protein
MMQGLLVEHTIHHHTKQIHDSFDQQQESLFSRIKALLPHLYVTKVPSSKKFIAMMGMCRHMSTLSSQHDLRDLSVCQDDEYGQHGQESFILDSICLFLTHHCLIPLSILSHQ